MRCKHLMPTALFIVGAFLFIAPFIGVSTDINEDVAYTITILDVSAEMARRAGMPGRFTVPSLGIDVALFEASPYSGSQDIVDAKDSAAIMPFGVQTLIADHNYQGFEAIKSAVPDKTLAYINDGQTVEVYICTKIGVGENITTNLLDESGNFISCQNPGGVCIYTCHFLKNKITYTFWQPVVE